MDPEISPTITINPANANRKSIWSFSPADLFPCASEDKLQRTNLSLMWLCQMMPLEHLGQARLLKLPNCIMRPKTSAKDVINKNIYVQYQGNSHFVRMMIARHSLESNNLYKPRPRRNIQINSNMNIHTIENGSCILLLHNRSYHFPVF